MGGVISLSRGSHLWGSDLSLYRGSDLSLSLVTCDPGLPSMSDLACARLSTLTLSISLRMSPFSMRGMA
jgi:hypothetical protein